MSIKILATGDLHIGKKVTGLSNSNQSYSAKDTWNRIVDWSVQNEVDVVLLTGDIVDRENRFFEAYGPLQKGFSQLKEKGIQVYLISGNHDADVLLQIVKSGDDLTNVHLMGLGGKWEHQLFTKANEEIQIVGWSFPEQYFRLDPLDSFNIPEINSELPCIGILHGDAYSKDSIYAPINQTKFYNLPVQTWILGHIHKPEMIRDNAPYICYPGSPLSLSPKETGHHGPLIIHVKNGIIQQPERIIFSLVRFEVLKIDITGTQKQDEMRQRVISKILEAGQSLHNELHNVKHLSFDISLTGKHTDIIGLGTWSQEMIGDLDLTTESGTSITVRKRILNVQPEITNIEELAKQNTPVGLLAQTILSIESSVPNDFADKLLAEWKVKNESLKNAKAYMPLKKGIGEIGDHESDAKVYLLKESYRILGLLLNQNK